MSLRIQDLAQQLKAELVGDSCLLIDDVAALESAGPKHLTYLESKKQLGTALKTRAGSILTTADLAATFLERGISVPILVVERPQVAFIEAMLIFRPPVKRSNCGVSPHALVAASAVIADGVNIWANAQIGEHVTIGSGCEIGPGVIIGDGCSLGENCTLHPNVVLYPGMQIHNRVIIHANAVVGADGFGYRFEAGQFIRIPHTGTVIIEDDVELGACATVDRAMIGATVIGHGTKLDNQVQIAHNCVLGKSNIFASQVGLAGSVTTGDYVQMGGQVGVSDHVKIGSGSKFGGKCGVIWDIPEQQISHGIPAIPEKDAIKNHFIMQKLPAMRDQLKELAKQVEQLNAQIKTLTPPDALIKSAA